MCKCERYGLGDNVPKNIKTNEVVFPVIKSTLASLGTALAISTTSVSAQDVALQDQNKTTISIPNSEYYKKISSIDSLNKFGFDSSEISNISSFFEKVDKNPSYTINQFIESLNNVLLIHNIKKGEKVSIVDFIEILEKGGFKFTDTFEEKFKNGFYEVFNELEEYYGNEVLESKIEKLQKLYQDGKLTKEVIKSEFKGIVVMENKKLVYVLIGFILGFLAIIVEKKIDNKNN